VAAGQLGFHAAQLPPNRYEHISRLGNYSFPNPAHLDPLHHRPLCHPEAPLA
jgi:hypothetical protein